MTNLLEDWDQGPKIQKQATTNWKTKLKIHIIWNKTTPLNLSRIETLNSFEHTVRYSKKN